MYISQIESVDSVCRDGTDMPYMQYKRKPGKLFQKHSHKLSKVPDLHHEVFCNQQHPKVGWYIRYTSTRDDQDTKTNSLVTVYYARSFFVQMIDSYLCCRLSP